MSLLAEYFKEHGAKSIIEDERGFATYAFMADGCYVEDIYVVPAYRSKGVAKEMLDRISVIAKERGCTKLFGSCVPTANNSTNSLLAAFSYGFKLHAARENFIVYVKEI